MKVAKSWMFQDKVLRRKVFLRGLRSIGMYVVEYVGKMCTIFGFGNIMGQKSPTIVMLKINLR
jgi:hypothetical protein